MKRVLDYISLFTSTATILCCALPALLVVLGLGASFASLVSYFPQIIFLSEYKGLVFFISAALIFLSFVISKRAQALQCPTDKIEACENTKQTSRWILYLAAGLWLIGFSFAYLLPLVL